MMSAGLEREIKLRFACVEDARDAVRRTGATPFRARRLQEDCLLDTADAALRDRGSVLRVRMEPGRSFLTFKGPVQPATTKLREELETLVGDGSVLLSILGKLGFRVWSRYQKFREEFTFEDVIVAIDETPVGVFIEVEGGERGIADMAEALGRGPGDYILDSYRGLFLRHCEQTGAPITDMLFDDE
jgi:adenylate cyclase class 2